jgi:hypothetical protein
MLKYLIILEVIKMDKSKELTKMIKGIKMGIYCFNNLERKNKSPEMKAQIEKALEVFHDQQKLMVSDAQSTDDRLSHDTTSLDFFTRCMLDLRLWRIRSQESIKKEAIDGLDMGVYQADQFLKKHPNLDTNFKLQIQTIMSEYKELINNMKYISAR